MYGKYSNAENRPQADGQQSGERAAASACVLGLLLLHKLSAQAWGSQTAPQAHLEEPLPCSRAFGCQEFETPSAELARHKPGPGPPCCGFVSSEAC